MNAKTFFKFLQHFDKYACPDRPVILLIDSVSSHIDLDVFTFAREKGIELYRLVPNATHFLQPLDNGVFGPLKKSWYQIVRKNTKENPDKSIGKENFAAKLQEAFLNFYKPLTVVNSFKSTGIFPIDRSKISESHLKPAMTFQSLSSEKEYAPFDCNNNSVTSHVVSPMSAVSVTPVTSLANPVSVLPGTSCINVTPHSMSAENMSLLTVTTTSHATPESALPGTSFVNVTPNSLSGDISGTSLLNATELQSPLSLLADVAFNLSNTISLPHSVSTCNVNSDSSDLSTCSNVNSTSSDVSSNVNAASSGVSTCITNTNTTPITPQCGSGVHDTVSSSVMEALVFPSCSNVKKRISTSDTLPDCLTSAESIRTSALKQLNATRLFARKELAAKKRYMKEKVKSQVKDKKVAEGKSKGKSAAAKSKGKSTAAKSKGNSAALSYSKKSCVSRVKAKKALSFTAGSKSDQCLVCKKLTEDPDGWVQCDICDSWIHVSCIPKDHDFDHAALTLETVEFFCHICVT
jgi:hypothetical protein